MLSDQQCGFRVNFQIVIYLRGGDENDLQVIGNIIRNANLEHRPELCREDSVEVNDWLFSISEEVMKSTCKVFSIGDIKKNANLEHRPDPLIGFTVPVSGR